MTKQRIPRFGPLSRGCRATCMTVVIFFTSCLLYFVVPSVYFSPGAQRFLDRVKQLDQISVTPAKKGELIAFTCRRPAPYGAKLYTVRADGSDLRLINTSVSKLQHELDWSSNGEWLVFTMSDDGYWSWDRPLVF